MESLERIKNIVDYIEQHIKERITLEDISERFHISKFHLHRLFSSLTGMPLMKYVRERKLSVSLFDLLRTKMNILDIAYEYGFSDEQSYIRAFKNTFLKSPAKLRKSNEIIKITDPIDLNTITPIGKGLVFEPKILIYPERMIVGVRSTIYDPQAKQSKPPITFGPHFYENYRDRIRNTLNDHIYLSYVELMPGLSDYPYYLKHYREPSKHHFITVSAEVTDLSNIPDGMVGLKVPAHKYARFTYIGFHSPNEVEAFDVGNIYEFIYCNWLMQSAYKLAFNFVLERIDLSVCRDDYTEFEIYIPIETK